MEEIDYSKLVQQVKDKQNTEVVPNKVSPSIDYNNIVQQAKKNAVGLSTEGGAVITPGLNPKEYSGYIGDLIRNQDYDELRAQSQNRFAKIGSGILNAVTQTSLDIIKDSSYLLDTDNITNFNKSSEEGFGNWLATAMQKTEDFLKAPVYRTKESQGFSPWSSGWWGDNIPSIVSTIAMALPAEGAVKSLGVMGKALGGEKIINSIEAVTGVSKGIIGNSVKGVGAAVISRQMESLMEGSQTFEETYKKAIDSGKSEEDAKKIAGEAAANNYKLNWAALIQDIPEYMFLHKTFKESSNAFSLKGAKEALGIAAIEGTEEGYQYITNKEAERSALIKGGVLEDDKTPLANRLIDYSKDGEFWTSTFLGALGGMGFGLYGVHKDNKTQQGFNALLSAHKSILKGDKDGYYRSQDDVLNHTITEAIPNGTLDKFKSGIEAILNNPERIKDEDREEVIKRAKENLKQIEYAEQLSKSIIHDTELSPELKKLALVNSLSQRSSENRLQEINKKILTLESKDAGIIGYTADTQAYKKAKLSLEGIKNIPNLINQYNELNKVTSKVAEDLIKAYPDKFKSIEDLNKSIISTNDNELKNLYSNQLIENDNLKQNKEINNTLSTKEGKESLEQIFKDKKVKEDLENQKENDLKTSLSSFNEKESISNEEYADFVDNNNVKEETLNSIAEKVKNKQPLSEKENAIFVSKTKEINNIIVKSSIDIESKKAEIERRRQEELKSRVVYDAKPTVEDGEFRIIGDPNKRIYRINVNTGRPQVLDESNGLWSNDAMAPNMFFESTKRAGFEKLKENINAKYDAELAALESGKNIDPLEALMNGDTSFVSNTGEEPFIGEDNAPVIEESSDVVNDPGVDYTEKGDTISNIKGFVAKALTVFKTENGVDDGKNKSSDRMFRWTNSVKNLADYKLLTVTKKSDKALYDKIVKELQEDKAPAGEFEKNNPNYDKGIHLVVVDNQSNPVLVDGKMLLSTLTDTKSIEEGRFLRNESPEELAKQKKDIENISNLRNTILSSDVSHILNIAGKSKGHPEFKAPTDVNGQLEVGRTPVEKALNSIDNTTIYLITVGIGDTGYSTLEQQTVKVGKAYVLNSDKTAFDLVPRKLTQEEASLIIDSLKNNNIKEVEKLIYWGTSNGKVLPYTIDRKDGIITIAGNPVDVNTPEGEAQLNEFLLNKYVNINKAYDMNKEFTLFGKSYKSYKHFLLEGENPLFGVRLKPKTEVQLRNQYLTYDPTPHVLNKQFEANKDKQEDISAKNNSNLEAKKADIENNDFVIKIKRIGQAYAGGKLFVNTTQTGKEFLEQVNYEMYGEKVQPEHLLYFKDKFGGKLYNLVNRGYKELTGKTFEEYDAELADLEKQKEAKIINNEAKVEAPVRKARVNRLAGSGKEINFGSNLDRLATRTANKTKLTQQETNWIKEVLPNVPVEKVIGLIEGKSFGQFLSNSKILLSDLAVKGTLYHEAFHAVTQLYLTKEEIKALYSEVREKSGNKNLTDLEVEEILAEDFAEYKETGKVLKDSPKRNSIFRRILSALKDFFNLKASTIQQVYERLDKGFYSNKKQIENRQFAKLNKSFYSEDKSKAKSVTFTKEVLDGVSSIFFDKLFKYNGTPDMLFRGDNVGLILNGKDGVFETIDAMPITKTTDWVLNNWEEVVNKFVERWKAVGFEINDEELDSDALTRSGNENAFKQDNEESTISTASKSTRLLIRSLPAVNKDGSQKLNSLGFPELVSFNKTYNFLLKELSGIGQTYEAMYNKIAELSINNPEYKILLERLGEPGEDDFDSFWFKSQFRQDFDKNYTDGLITMINPDGDSYVISSAKQAISERVKDAWKAKTALLGSQNSEGRLIINIDKEAPLKTFKDKLNFLESIGITFSPETLSKVETPEFEKAVISIKNELVKNGGDVTNLYDNIKKFNESKNVRDLVELEAYNTKDVPELSVINASGKSIYLVGLNSSLTNIKNLINQAKNIGELVQLLPNLNTSENFYTVDGKYIYRSVYLNNLFDENGNKKQNISLEYDLNLGLNTESEDNSEKYKKDTVDLTAGEKYLQDITLLLSTGRSSLIQPSDKSTNPNIGLSNKELQIPIEDLEKDFNVSKVNRIFKGYFESEVLRISKFILEDIGKDIDQYAENGGTFSLFKDFSFDKKFIKDIEDLKDRNDLSLNEKYQIVNNLISENLKPFLLSVHKYFEFYTKELTNDLNKNKVELSKEFTSKYSKEQLIRAVAINDWINSVEQTKLFLGDLAFYKDLFKRIGGGSGTKQMLGIGDYFNNFLNNKNKRLDGKIANDKINVQVFSDVTQQSNHLDEYIDSIVKSGLSEIQAKKLLGRTQVGVDKNGNPKYDDKAYFKMDEGDAQGWITLDEYREFNLRLGDNKFWDKKFEKAYDKLIKQWKEYKQTGKISDENLLTKDEIVQFKVLKAMEFGPQEYSGLYVPSYHKFSLMPLIPQLCIGKNLEVMLNDMIDNQIGYRLFKSGSKIGTLLNNNGKANSFYTEGNHGEINTKNLITQVVSYQFIGLQTKTSDPKEKVIFGTQFRKLLESNLYENGVTSWDSELLSNYDKIISDKVDREFNTLLDDLGLNKDTYVVEDIKKLVDILKEEAKKRDLPDNIIDSLDYEITDTEQKLLNNFDTSMIKSKIDSMLMSLANSRVIRQKLNGDALVQGASSGFEKLGVREIGSNKVLSFYTEGKDGAKTTHAECMVPMSNNYKSLLKKYNNDLDKLNQAIKDGKISKEQLTLVGYRIPTQGLNSMDFFVIKEFTPENSGAMILPTEIVAKSGGDYDIDKMNIFRPYLDGRGNLIKSKSVEELSELWEKIKNKTIEKLVGKEDEAVDKLITAIFGEEFPLTDEDIKDLLEEGDVISKQKFINLYLNKLDNNKIIDIAYNILSDNRNFTSLITPNSTHILTDVVEDIRYIKYLNDHASDSKKKDKQPLPKDAWLKSDKANKDNIRYSDQLKLTTKNSMFVRFMLAKQMIGIAAVANTSHTIAQKFNWSVNKIYEKIVDKFNNFYKDKYITKEQIDNLEKYVSKYGYKVKTGFSIEGKSSWKVVKNKKVNINFTHHQNTDGTISLSKTYDVNKDNKISEVISQIINATVDAAKDPFLFDLNMTLETLGTYVYLIRIGVPFEDVAYFMKQPILQKYFDALKIEKSGYIKDKINSKNIVDNLLKEYSDKLSKENRDVENEILDKSKLYPYLSIENQSSQDFYKTQIQVLKDYLAYKEQANLLLKAVQATNHDTSGLNKNLEATDLKLKAIQEALTDNFVNGIDDVLNKSFIGKMNLNSKVQKMFDKFYYTRRPEFKAVTTDILNKINPFKDDDKLDLATLINNDLINYVVQNYGFVNNQGESIISDLRDKLFKGDNSIAKQLIRLKQSKLEQNLSLQNNLIIKELFSVINSLRDKDGKIKENNQDNIKLFTRRIDTYTSNQLTEAFREIKEKDPELFKNLADLGILQSGLNNSAITYVGLIPNEYYNELVKTAFENFNKKNGVEDLYKFEQLFYRNNIQNPLISKSKVVENLTKLGENQWGKDYDLKNWKEGSTKEEPIENNGKNTQLNNIINLEKLLKKPLENLKIKISNTLQDFINVFIQINDESVVEPFAEKLTNEDKQILAKAIGRNYKDINNFDWYNDIWSDVGKEEVFYYLKTGNQLERDVKKELFNSKLYKDYQTFYNENKQFVDGFYNLPEEIKKEQVKDFNKLKEKDTWFKQKFDEFEYNKRKELLNSTGFQPDIQFSKRQNEVEKALKNSKYFRTLEGKPYTFKRNYYPQIGILLKELRNKYPGVISETKDHNFFGYNSARDRYIELNNAPELIFDKSVRPEATAKQISETQIREILDKIVDRLTINGKKQLEYSIVTPEEAVQMLKDIGVKEEFTVDNVPAFYKNGVSIIPNNYMTREVAIHEALGHPLVDAIFEQNKALFLNNKRQLQDSDSGREIIKYVKTNYPNLVKNGELTDKGWKEAIVTALGKMADKQLDEVKDKGLISALKQLLKRIGDYLQSLFNDGSKVIKPIEIDVNTTLEELATMLNLDNKIDLSKQSTAQVQYNLKSLNFLSSEKATQLFNKFFNSDKEKFYKEITQFVGKDQLELIKSIVDNQNPNTLGDIMTSLLANYSYTVEINTAKEKYSKEIDGFIHDGGVWINMQEARDATKEETEKLDKKLDLENTQYYSNLTVPGGTNYTENEIATPTITPSIKGHAQFATDKGIGWFRSDDKSLEVFNENNIPTNRFSIPHPEDRSEIIYYKKNNKWYIEDKLNSDREVSNDYISEIYSKRFDKSNETPTKTRRILEVQSDLFQKGRNADELIGSEAEILYELDKMGKPDSTNMEDINEARKRLATSKQNQFLQLLNKDNNWVTFFVKSIIQDSAKQTITEVQDSDIEAKVRELENSGLLKIKCD